VLQRTSTAAQFAHLFAPSCAGVKVTTFNTVTGKQITDEDDEDADYQGGDSPGYETPHEQEDPAVEQDL